MKAYECYHCKQWIAAGQEHDCWTTTESALTRELSEDLQDAYQRLREAATDLGEQRVYASHHSIMFARRACYFFVRPKKNFLEVVIFLGRALKAPQVRRVEESSKAKRANFVRITHRDEVEAPFTDWLREAYAFVEAPKPTSTSQAPAPSRKKSVKPKKKPPRRTTATSSTRRDRPSARR